MTLWVKKLLNEWRRPLVFSQCPMWIHKHWKSVYVTNTWVFKAKCDMSLFQEISSVSQVAWTCGTTIQIPMKKLSNGLPWSQSKILLNKCLFYSLNGFYRHSKEQFRVWVSCFRTMYVWLQFLYRSKSNELIYTGDWATWEKLLSISQILIKYIIICMEAFVVNKISGILSLKGSIFTHRH